MLPKWKLKYKQTRPSLKLNRTHAHALCETSWLDRLQLQKPAAIERLADDTLLTKKPKADTCEKDVAMRSRLTVDADKCRTC
jgi:hypothetical protein